MTDAQDFKVYNYINFEKYEEANEALTRKAGTPKVIFMGNSITEGWDYHSPDFMKSNGYINRGISGQTTDQMLLRFRKDVLDHQPQLVVILAGTNDIAQNSGQVPIWHTMNNIKSMAELAKANRINVLLCSVLPAKAFPWRPGIEPIPLISELNTLIKNYARQQGMHYVDYYSALEDGKGGLKVPDYTSAEDLVHPNAAGYAIMEQVVQSVIKQALK